MRRIQASLPTLGLVAIELHDESARLLDLLGGTSELDRLDSIGHLGVSAYAFAGAAHSRLEYLLLQWALIGLTKKIYKDHPLLSLGAKVKLPGRKTRLSSGEELLKVWALLSNGGHAKYTYGVERTILLASREESPIADWLVAFGKDATMRAWNRGVIASFEDWNVHHLLLQARLSLGEGPVHTRGLAQLLLKCLVIPSERLRGLEADERKKLERLRDLYYRIRLLSMVTLDSYYSHHPVRVQVAGAITSLAGGGDPAANLDRLGNSLSAVGEWLADDLYLHPDAIALQRAYEIKRVPLFKERAAKAIGNKKEEKHLIKNTLYNGLGEPAKHHLTHFVRLSFPSLGSVLMGGTNSYATLQHLESKVTKPPRTFASVDRNYFSRTYHLDFLYDATQATTVDLSAVLVRLRDWLVRALDARALRSGRVFLGRIRPSQVARPNPGLERARERQLRSHTRQLRALLHATLRYVLPPDRDFTFEAPTSNAHGGYPNLVGRARWSPGETSTFGFDSLVNFIKDNPAQLTSDRLQELRGLAHCFKHSKAPFVVGTSDSLLIADLYGTRKDEWDGVLLEIWDDRVVVKVIETKHTGSKSTNETESFKQLKQTARLLRFRDSLAFRRVRIPSLGACLSITLPL